MQSPLKVSLSKYQKDMSEALIKPQNLNKENPVSDQSATKLQSTKSLLKASK